MGECVRALRPPARRSVCVGCVLYLLLLVLLFFCLFGRKANSSPDSWIGVGDGCMLFELARETRPADGRTDGMGCGAGGGVGIGMRIYGSGSVYFARGGRQGTSERRGEMMDGVGASTYIHIPICASLFLHLLFSLLPLFQRMCSNN